jgi:hypothetical protein
MPSRDEILEPRPVIIITARAAFDVEDAEWMVTEMQKRGWMVTKKVFVRFAQPRSK